MGTLVFQAPARLGQETPFLREPGGLRLATLAAGARVAPGRTAGDYTEVTFTGWIWSASLRPDRRDGYELSVRANGGEKVRAAPDGELLGRAVEGALFSRVSRRGGWTLVRRTGWVSRAALAAPVVARASRPAPPPAPPPPAPRAVEAPRPATPARDTATPKRDPAAVPPRPAPDTVPGQRVGSLRKGATLQTAPDGPAIATLAAPADVSVVGTEHEWAKVRIEGWVRTSEVEGAVSPRPAITAAMLREAPERYVGQTVQWRLQFLARQEADELRPEMPLGHPYLLARGPLPETGFVYVMVSKEEAARLQGLKPLDELAVLATVRAARTRYLATPVVELIRVGEGK